jgi:hypothetical protein
MRCTKLAFACLAIAAALFAAEPFAGTWTLNAGKSKYKTGQPPKEQTVTIAESGSDLEVTIKGTAANGTPISTRYMTPAAGGEGKIIASSDFDAVSSKRIGPNRREVSYSKGGKVIETIHSTVSRDGKTLTVSVKGTDGQGKPIDAVVVYDRQ